jgi:hypothetical protein
MAVMHDKKIIKKPKSFVTIIFSLKYNNENRENKKIRK